VTGSPPAIRRALSIFARVALGAGFLSAVADRFGLWGGPGARHVAWGDFAHFLEYTRTLNPWLPARLIPALGWFVTITEIVLGVALVAGVARRLVAALSRRHDRRHRREDGPRRVSVCGRRGRLPARPRCTRLTT
jgi:uncharacterized membrane protein YphA (DoxX/SURF4 family)